MSGQPTVVALQKEELMELLKNCAEIGAQTGAKVAAATLQKEYAGREKEKKDRRLHNVRLLLSHYQEFEDHVREAVYSSQQIKDEDVLENLMTMKNDEVIVESILRTTMRTKVILEHIDAAMRTFEIIANENGKRNARQYEVLRRYYFSEGKSSMQEIANELGMSKGAVHNALRNAEEQLAVLFFGIDGLKL